MTCKIIETNNSYLMKANELTEEIGNLIANDQINTAIQKMKALFADSPKLNEVLLQSAKHREVMQEITRGTISFEQSSMTKNQIRFSLLGILNDIDTHATDPVIAEEISKFEFSGIGNVIQQSHSGTGDNVGRDKVVTTNYKMKVGVLVATIILATATALLFPMLMPKAVPLTGYVVSSAQKPVKGAKVIYTGTEYGKKESFTDVSGQFRFEEVNTKKIGSFSLQAFVEGRQAKLDTTGIEELGLGDLQLKLPPGNPPFDVSYYDLKEEAITWLVNGTRKGYVTKTRKHDDVDETWEKTFRGKPFVIKNKIVDELKSIYSSYREPWVTNLDDDVIQIPFAKYYSGDSRAEVANWASIINSDRWKRDGKSLSADAMKKIITAIPEDRMKAYEYFQLPGNNLYNTTIFPNQEELKPWSKKVEPQSTPEYSPFNFLKFYSYISRNHVPDDFLQLSISSILQDGCIEENSRLTFPKMYVQVAVIENNTSGGIELDSFYLQANLSDGLRSI